ARSRLSRGRPPGRDGDAVMPVCRGAFGAALLVTLLMPPIQARGQAGRSTGASKRLAALRVGQWGQLEGSLRSDSTAVCTEVRLLTGDFLEDDWALKGTVRSADPARRELSIGPVRVELMEHVVFDDPRPGFRRFSDLRPGMLIEVGGTYKKSG